MNQATMSYGAFIYAKVVAMSLPRSSFDIQFLSDSGSKKQILCQSASLPDGDYDLYKLHMQLASLNLFHRNSSTYEHISQNGTLHVTLTDIRGEAVQSIKLNSISSLSEDENGGAEFSSAHKVAEFVRKGAVWTASANLSSLQANSSLMLMLAKVLYQRTSDGRFQYCAGGRSLEDTKALMSIHPLLQQSLRSWHEMEEAEKLVIQQGKEKSKRFSKRKRNEDLEETQQVPPVVAEENAADMNIVADIVDNGASAIVSAAENSANEIDLLEQTSYNPYEASPEDKPS